MKTKTKNLLKFHIIIFSSLVFTNIALAYEQSDAAKKYDKQSGSNPYGSKPSSRSSFNPTRRERSVNRGSDSYRAETKSRASDPSFRSKYSRYKKYSPEKKQRVQKKWSTFKKGSNWNRMSDSQKSNLKRKVLEKRKIKRRSYR